MIEDSSNSETKDSSNQMYLFDIRRTVDRADTLEEALSETKGVWKSLYDRMNATETLWVVAPNDYRDGRMWPVAMATADYVRNETNLLLKNNITLHCWGNRAGDMGSAYDEILLFVKDMNEYQFYKDRIRVAHIYEGHEWGGKREKGKSTYHDTKVKRYNENGKDPGNVWLKEIRTQTHNQSVDETRPLSLTEAIRRCVLVGSNMGEKVYIIDLSENLKNTITEEERGAEPLYISDLCVRGE
jgi:hypothetical protein